MIDCEFDKYIDLKKLFAKHGITTYTINIGSNGSIYILAGSEYCGINRERFGVLVLDVDWDDEKLISDTYYDLGEFDDGYYFVQPIGENILMVKGRAEYNNGNPEKNAYILTLDGEVINNFCLGDGIQDVYVRPDGMIVTSYFDEGVFGNLGWGDPGSAPPIGSPGLIVWNENGEKILCAKHNIADCYALNVDTNNDIWYYYYDDFKLVKCSGDKEIDFDPHIEGATFLLPTEDGQKVIFDSGYDKHGLFEVYNLYKNSPNEKFRILFEGKEVLLIANYKAYGSRALFYDSEKRMYIRRFISV